jgi:uncharacterized phage protein (TIGR02218 family)
MADYGQFETTRQGAQPLEGYVFFWGNGSVAGTSAAGVDGSGGAVFGSTLPACGGTAAPTPTFTDTWTGGNDTDIAGRTVGVGTWTNVAPAGAADIVSGVLVSQVTAQNYGAYTLNGTGLGANQSISLTGKFTANPVAGAFTWFALIWDADVGLSLYCTLARSIADNTLSVVIDLYDSANPLPIETYTTTAFTLNTEHTIRMDVVGTKLYGYLDDVLVALGTDTAVAPVNPGALLGTSTAGVQQAAVTRFAVGAAVAAGNETQVASYGMEHWDGPDDPEIDGRTFDGGGQVCLSSGIWTKTITRVQAGAIVSNEAHYTPPSGGTGTPWTHYVATGLTGVGNDYRIESTWRLIGQPPGSEQAWASLIARHTLTSESGYEFICFVEPGGVGVGGTVFRIDKIVSESYTTLVNNERLTGAIALGDHSIAMHVEGNRICGYYDGELVAVAVDPANLYPSGYPGICFYGEEVVVTSWSVYADPVSQPCGGGGTGAVGEPLLTLAYTTADVPWTYQGIDFIPFIGHRTNFNSGSGERTAAEIELSVPFDHPVATLAMQGVPRGPIGCTVYRVDRQDLTDGAAAIPLQGQITRYHIEGRWCVVTLGNVGTLLTRKLPRMLTQRSCPHVLYGPFCQADQSAFTFAGLEVISVLGRSVTVSGASAMSTDATYFQEGVLLTTDGLREFIEAQSGDTLQLKQPVPGLGEGDTVTLVAGCDHKARTCDTRFNNIQHYGGEIGMPDRNPATGAGLQGTGSSVEAA